MNPPIAPELAILVGGIVEEAAQAGLNAGSIGGPVEIPEELRAAALQRAMVFDSQGTQHAWTTRDRTHCRMVLARRGLPATEPGFQAAGSSMGPRRFSRWTG